MKKYFFLVAAALSGMLLVSSCDDTESDAEGGTPVVNKVLNLSAGDSILTAASADMTGKVEGGSYICIMGENLGSVSAVRFGDKTVLVKEAYRSENQLLVEVPALDKTSKGFLITPYNQAGYEFGGLDIVIGAPKVYMIYNEFAPDGDWLKVKGQNLVGTNLAVYFKDNAGNDLECKGSDSVKVQGNLGQEAWFKIPEGTGNTFYPVIKNLNEPEGGDFKKSTFPILFRDRSNILCDFENNLQWTDAVGSYDKAGGTTWDVFAQAVDPSVELDKIEGNYACDLKGNKIETNQFALFDNFGKEGKWCGYNEMIDETLASDDDYLKNSVFRNLTEDIIAGTVAAEKLVVKFEVNVAKMKGPVVLYVCFSSGLNDDPLTEGRDYCAALNMGEVMWDKSDPEKGWVGSGIKTISTDGWMTVAVPLTEMYQNIRAMSYGSSAENLVKGTVPDKDKTIYGNGKDNTPMVSKYPLKSVDDVSEHYGSLSFMDCPWGNSWYTFNQKDVRFAIDNIRIVKDDGNGAVYPYINWGVPSQHFIDKPRTRPF